MRVQLFLVVIFSLFCFTIAHNGELAKTKCIEYANYKRNCSDSTCNAQTGSQNADENGWSFRVLGGTPVDRFDYPHMAAIGYGNMTELKYLCGGTLLSENYVITAAHCQTDPERGDAAAVRLGSSNLIFDDANTHIIPVEEFIVHSGYKPRSKYNDIALIRLKRKVEFNEFIWPACINTDLKNTNWPFVTAIGFGITSIDNTDGSDQLLKVRLSIIPRGICRNAFPARPYLRQGIIESQLCAGDLVGHKDTCRGDSGGPLQILLESTLNMYVIVGITSFGKKCGFAHIPAVYTNVAYFTSWIEEIVWGEHSPQIRSIF